MREATDVDLNDHNVDQVDVSEVEVKATGVCQVEQEDNVLAFDRKTPAVGVGKRRRRRRSQKSRQMSCSRCCFEHL